jgi:hypothetical protein
MTRALTELMRIEVADDQMSAFLVLESGGQPGPLDAPFAESLLTSQEIPLTRERSAAIRRALEQYALNPGETHRVQIAFGVEPVHALGTRLELRTRRGSEECRVVGANNSSASGDPDAEAESGTDEPLVVEVGDVIGHLHPSTPGADGMDVFGRVVKAWSARPSPITIDKSIEIDSDGTLSAKTPGLVEVMGRRLRISDTLRIDGSVDAARGDVDFPRHVIVSGGVHDGRVVRAGGMLQVGDLAQACDLQSGRDLILELGMSGRGQGVLRAGRDLRAKYLSDVKAVVVRDAHLVKDVSNCDLRVGRHVRGSSCTLMRGELWVGRSCELAHVGTDANVPTTIVLGKFEALEQAARQALQLAPEVLEQHERSREALSTLQRASGRLTPTQAEELTELQFECARDEGTLRQLERGMRTIADQMAKFSRAELLVHGVLHPGVRIWIGGYCVEFLIAVQGPIRIALDEHGGPYCLDTSINEKQPLSKIARVRADPRFVDLEYEARNLGLCLRPVASKAA